MSFNPQNLQMWSSNAIPGAKPPHVPTEWAYYTQYDTLAVILAPGYFKAFADFNSPILPPFSVNDLIYCVTPSGNFWLTVTAINEVTVALFQATKLFTSGTITATQFLDMYATPIEIIPAVGPHSAIILENCFIEVDYSTAAFAAGGAIAFQYGNFTHGAGIQASVTVAAAIAQGWTANSVLTVGGIITGAEGSNEAASVINEGIYLSNGTQPFTTGGSTLYYHLPYTVYPTRL